MPDILTFAGLRNADWLAARRARIYLALVALTMLVLAGAAAGRIAMSAWSDAQGRPVISDFDAFWAAARLGLAGHGALAYSEPAIRAAEAAAVQPTGGSYLPYFYPPTFSLLCLPLGLLPYLAALAVFVLAGLAAAVACLRRILPPAWPCLAILVFPGLVMNAAIAQAGFVATLCLSGAMLLLERRPFLAGACLGGLAYRPQLALCVPVALVCARRWRAISGCAASIACLLTVSAAALGLGTWRAFAGAVPMIARVPQMPDIMPKLLSTYGAVRALHFGARPAYAMQMLTALGAVLTLAWVARKRPGAGAEMAALTASALLCTPYMLDYDLACLSVPLAWLAASGGAGLWLPWEKIGLLVLYMLPLVARTLTMTVGIPVTPVLLAGLLALVAKRAGRLTGNTVVL